MITKEEMDAATLFEEIRELSQAGGIGGVTRPSYGLTETAALERCRKFATEAGLVAEDDAVGNLWVGKPRVNDPIERIVIGSHLDSVPNGGNYDGLAGVVAGLLVLRRLKDYPTFPVNVVALRGEESAWYGECYKGSKALFGKLTPRGELSGAMVRVGVKPDRVNMPFRPVIDPSLISAFLELHIEQGPVLVERQAPLGIVGAIRGNTRCLLQVRGEANHSGTTPRELRRDAVLALAEFLRRAETIWSNKKEDLVFTCGVVHTDPEINAITRVPEFVQAALEWRSTSVDVLRNFGAELKIEAGEISDRRKLSILFTDERLTLPAAMSEEIQGHLMLACSTRTLSNPPSSWLSAMPSGAGHDAAIFAAEGIPTGMLLVRNQHGSHNPKEDMALDDFMVGVDVLTETTKRIAAARV